ncbi:synaptonemal complex protein 1-like isoform X1 [Coffea arabica]|uniref:Synaptonemal complex protein 1-like isoform X1 n=1 Tax=Coffea arabica TaxID=13443 RepID=A0ABM4UGP6_COFAR
MLLCHLPACSGACCNILLSSGIRFSQAHSLLTGQGAATFAVGCIGTDLVPFVGLSSSFVDPGRHKKLETPKVVTPRAVTKGTKGQVHTNSSNIGDLFSEGSLNPYADDPYAFD